MRTQGFGGDDRHPSPGLSGHLPRLQGPGLWVALLSTGLLFGCTDTAAVDGPGGSVGFQVTDVTAGADGSVPLLDGTGVGTGDITYYGQVKAILQVHCVACHTFGEAGPLDLTTYEAAREARAAIAFEVDSGRMPPWHAAPGCDEYNPDLSMSQEERDTLMDWVAHAAPEGYPANYIPPFVDPPVTLSGPTISMGMAETYTPQADGEDIRCFPITWPGDAPLYITGAHVTPGVRPQVHQVIAFSAGPEMAALLAQSDFTHDGPGYPCFGNALPSGDSASSQSATVSVSWLTAWAPGGGANLFPTGTGILMEPGDTVVLQVHYDTSSVAPTPDLTTVDFQVANSVELPSAIYPFTNFAWLYSGNSMLIPAGEAEVTHTHSDDITKWASYLSLDLGRTENDPLWVHGAALQMLRLGKSGSISLRRSNGAEDCLLDIAGWDFDWQRSYRFTEPKLFNPGDMIDLRCTWDNSQVNQPWTGGAQATAQDVGWGDGDGGEMCLGFLFVSAMSNNPDVCTPSCGLKECGGDGCGGSCGDCPTTAPFCDEVTFQCTAQCQPNCNLKQCGDDGCGGSCGDCPLTAPNCDPSNHQCTAMCIPTCDADVQCGSDGCGGNCGVCPTNAPYCIQGICYANPEGTCLPACDGKQCGADGCGGNCGICPTHAPTCTDGLCGGTCQANCTGKQCGDDGCGGNCGECPDWAPSCVNDFCVDDCVPDCIGKQCGDDGCGGVCGFCGADAACVSGECKLGCGDPCEGKNCGDNGCGGSCGACGGTFVCQNNICVDMASCTPSCFGKQCGDDGCGGSCGSCSGNLWCQNGTCVGNGCTPNCQNIQCGPDGCGGSCGTCLGNSWCQNGVCTGGGCTPSCTNKECGDDGCGGSCGSCPGGTTCNGSGICASSGGNNGQGACMNAADQAILAQIDAQTMATECGLGCIGDLNPSACATTCLQAQSNLSNGCAGCFGKLVGCIIDNCLTNCISPESVECKTCMAAQCGSSFEACSGLTLNQ